MLLFRRGDAEMGWMHTIQRDLRPLSLSVQVLLTPSHYSSLERLERWNTRPVYIKQDTQKTTLRRHAILSGLV